MIIRYEKTSDDNVVLVISEVNKFLGEINLFDLIDCMEERDPFEEDDLTYWFVSKEKLNLYFQSFSAEKSI